MRRKWIGGNWKMNGSLATIAELLPPIIENFQLKNTVTVALFPPNIYLPYVHQQIVGTELKLGAQNLSQHQAGAFTGETAANMLRDYDCQYVLVGHSERRHLFAESDDIVAAKFAVAQEQGLTPVLCVGETLAERENKQTIRVIKQQIHQVIARVGVRAFQQAVIAYEPVWAIGTGKTAAPAQAQEVHQYIREELAALDETVGKQMTIVYGGSVKAANVDELFSQPDIDGGLIGGASLVAEEFIDICLAGEKK